MVLSLWRAAIRSKKPRFRTWSWSRRTRITMAHSEIERPTSISRRRTGRSSGRRASDSATGGESTMRSTSVPRVVGHRRAPLRELGAVGHRLGRLDDEHVLGRGPLQADLLLRDRLDAPQILERGPLQAQLAVLLAEPVALALQALGLDAGGAQLQVRPGV